MPTGALSGPCTTKPRVSGIVHSQTARFRVRTVKLGVRGAVRCHLMRCGTVHSQTVRFQGRVGPIGAFSGPCTADRCVFGDVQCQTVRVPARALPKDALLGSAHDHQSRQPWPVLSGSRVLQPETLHRTISHALKSSTPRLCTSPQTHARQPARFGNRALWGWGFRCETRALFSPVSRSL